MSASGNSSGMGGGPGKRARQSESLAFDFGVYAPKPAAPPAPVIPAIPVTSPVPIASLAKPAERVEPEVRPEKQAASPEPTASRAPSVNQPPGSSGVEIQGQPEADPEVLSVAQLGRVLTRTLERTFPMSVWVEGEVSGARAASSGHLYFALKDENEDAVVDVVVYRANVTARARTLVKDGARVRLRARPTFWAPRGRMQLVGERLEPTGKGALLEALEKLKAKLQAEGLFAPERKRRLPAEPRVIGVVTSASGAVIHDICKVSFRRGGAQILLAPAQVQGAGAAESVRRALAALQLVPNVDVIIVGRGGGSQDDLLAFHDEQLVRDVAACRVPVVSAVGHETDVTLVDFAADARAATPSQAAEMVVPDAHARRRLLEERSMRVRRAMHARITEERARTLRLSSAFRDPRLSIASGQQRVDDLAARMARAVTRVLSSEMDAVVRLGGRLSAAHPRERIAKDAAVVSVYHARLFELMRAALTSLGARASEEQRTLENAMRMDLREEHRALSELAGRLDAMSPLKVLGRGYAIATRVSDGQAIRSNTEVRVGDEVHVRLASGALGATITRTIGES